MAIDTSTPTAPTATTQAQLPTAPRMSGRDKLVLFVLCAAQFMVALDFSVLNVALPVLGPDLGMGRSALQWAVTAFALPSGGFLLLFGRVGDLFGRRRMFLGGLTLFALASLLATFAWDPASFLTGRALQGIGAAAVVPTGMALLTTTFPEGPLRARALGVFGTLLSLGFTTGMVLGGILTESLGWRSTMGLLTVFAVIVLPLAPRLLPESRTPNRPRLDVPGAITVTGGLLSLIYALSTAAEHGFGGIDVIVTLIAGPALLAAFVVIESRTAEPLLSLPLLRRSTVAWGNVGGLITFSMMTTVVFVLTLYLQEVLHLSALATGLAFGFQGAVAAVTGTLVPRLISRVGAHRTLVAALAWQGALTVPLVLLGTSGAWVWLAVIANALVVIGHMAAIIAYGATATAGVTDAEQGLATGLVTSSQQLGLTIGIPLIGVLATTAPQLLTGARTAFAVDAAIVLVAAVLVGLGLRTKRA
ncbi:MFS transporter [Streptomyces sp. NPDC002790]|uniref:MFS transporter n=1 Tax=Streptomyces sp. NPDC002790 TaxID=3154431 RepID=UPI00332EA934